MIEDYRRKNAISDRGSAFGAEPKDGAAKARQRNAMERIERVRRELGEPGARRARAHSIERDSFGIGR